VLDAKCTNGSRRAGVLAVELVDSIAVKRPFPARHRAAGPDRASSHRGILVITVACVVHAWQFVVEIPRVVFARIILSGTGHPSLLALLFGLAVNTPWQYPRGLVQGCAEAPIRQLTLYRDLIDRKTGDSL